MKSGKIKVLILSIILFISISLLNSVYASALTLEVKADKESANVEENIVITVDWKEKMQAADYVLKYDSSKLEYVSSSLEDTYINKTQEGKIGVSWFSSDNTDLTQNTFTFKVKEEGKTNVSVEIDGGFADGNLVQPESYDVETKGNIEIKLVKENKGVKYALIVCAVLAILVIVIEVVHNKNKKDKNA